MLIHPWDAALDDEWRTWPADGHDFGQLVVNGLPGQPPVVIPTHFSVEDAPTETVLLVHLARPNPVWKNRGRSVVATESNCSRPRRASTPDAV
ncbi:FMN-binding negative transcriptional regulator [Blastococcus deserti]|uniref:FMN-binding negative transcriptional regulator n=1 Tax=Blastococcus deserti TaxID=2259033 RepID=A0ABW4XCX1_9ACTN